MPTIDFMRPRKQNADGSSEFSSPAPRAKDKFTATDPLIWDHLAPLKFSYVPLMARVSARDDAARTITLKLFNGSGESKSFTLPTNDPLFVHFMTPSLLPTSAQLPGITDGVILVNHDRTPKELTSTTPDQDFPTQVKLFADIGQGKWPRTAQLLEDAELRLRRAEILARKAVKIARDALAPHGGPLPGPNLPGVPLSSQLDQLEGALDAL